MIAPIGAVGATTPGAPLAAARAAQPAATAAPVAGSDSGFGDLVQRGLQNVSGLEHTADALTRDLATGGTARVEDVMVATTQAQLGIELLARVRDRALEAYQEVMRLPV